MNPELKTLNPELKTLNPELKTLNPAKPNFWSHCGHFSS